MNTKYKRFENETDEELIYRICSDKEQIGSWQDVANVINKLTGNDFGESTYRKKFQSFQKMLNANQSKFANSDAQLEEIQTQIRELKKERIKLQTEKLEYTKWIREDARDELFEEKVINSIKDNVKDIFMPSNIEVKYSNKEGVLCLADAHFGKEYKIYGLLNEVINEYSPEIFYSRMDQIYSEMTEIINKENLTKLHIYNLGDSVEGFIRNSQIWSLRWGVIDSATIFGNYIGRWLLRLSEKVNVEYHQTDGNHDELRLLDGKKGQHLCESAGKIVTNCIKLINENNPNFLYKENKTGLIYDNVCGYNILGIHGEVRNLVVSINEFSDIYNTKISYLIAGHKHHSEFVNCGVKKGCIGIGSIVGSDDFSMTIRKSADATASFIMFEDGKGKVDEHTFVLN